MTPKRIGFLGFDGITALDLVGPAEAFATASMVKENGARRRCYEVITIGLSSKPFVAESGIAFQPQKTIKTAPALDTLIVPGGRGLRQPAICQAISTFLKARSAQTRRIASVCTGVYALAATGLLDGRKCTTHWRFAADVAQRFPRILIQGDAIFLKDGPFYTSAGVTAGIDLSLSLIEEDCGPEIALSVARELVVYLKRSGGQEQYSEPLKFQSQSTDRFADLAAWIAGHLHRDLSLDILARRACFSPRHFARRFKAIFGATPADFIEKLRLDEARRQLSEARNSIENVGALVGFHSPQAFRRAFNRQVGINPLTYRRRFQSDPA
ncbi:MAG: GlxA family transcriptional regulator [Chthoniobacterales bacterium]